MWHQRCPGGQLAQHAGDGRQLLAPRRRWDQRRLGPRGFGGLHAGRQPPRRRHQPARGPLPLLQCAQRQRGPARPGPEHGRHHRHAHAQLRLPQHFRGRLAQGVPEHQRRHELHHDAAAGPEHRHGLDPPYGGAAHGPDGHDHYSPARPQRRWLYRYWGGQRERGLCELPCRDGGQRDGHYGHGRYAQLYAGGRLDFVCRDGDPRRRYGHDRDARPYRLAGNAGRPRGQHYLHGQHCGQLRRGQWLIGGHHAYIQNPLHCGPLRAGEQRHALHPGL